MKGIKRGFKPGYELVFSGFTKEWRNGGVKECEMFYANGMENRI